MYEEDDQSNRSISEYSDTSLHWKKIDQMQKEKKRQEILQFYDAQQFLPFETSVITSQIVDILFKKGGDQLYEKYLLTKMPDHESKYTCGIMAALVGQDQLFGDPGESPKELEILWSEEKEPSVLHYDSRSTYAINIDFKQVIINETEFDNDDDAKSIMSSSSRFSFVSKKTNKLISSANRIMTLSKINQNVNDSMVKKPKVEQFQSEIVRMPDELPPEPDPVADRLRLAREKKDYVKGLEMEKQRKQMQDELDFENKKKEAQKLLKHKQFTQDYNGNIIFLKKDRESIQIPSNIITLDAKNRLPADIVKEAILPDQDGKLVKQMNFKSKINQKILETLEFHNQPLLHLTFKANPGNKLKTKQGQLIEGGFLSIQNRMRKGEYDKMVESLPNRPVANYLGSTEAQKHDLEQSDEIKERKFPRLSLHSSSQLRIYNKEALQEMLSENKRKRKSTGSQQGSSQTNHNKDQEKSLEELREEYLLKEKEKEEKEKKKKELAKQVKLEKVTLYPQTERGGGETVDLGFQSLIQSSVVKKKQPVTLLHLEVEKFDLKNIKDPLWGDNIAKSSLSIQLEENKKVVKEPVNFKIRKQQKLINSNKSMKMTVSKFFNA